MADLMVQIGADATQYNAGMNQVAQTAQRTAATVTQSLAQAAASAQQSGSSIARSSGTAAYALTNLGRVAQDAPFGFIGIQNNINPLLESFQRLRAETGSTGSALKALAGSLAGAGGLGLAVSVVTAAFTIYTMWQQRANKGHKDLTDSTKAYVDTLDSVRQAQLKGQQDGNAELVRTELIYKATQNHTLSIQQRNAAYDELSRMYPKFFTNAEREKTLLGQNTEGYNLLAKSILAAASAKAYEAKIGENANRAFEDQQKINDALLASKKAQADIDKAGAVGTGGGTIDQANKVSSAYNTIAKSEKLINDLKTDQTKLYNQNIQLNKLALDSELAGDFKTKSSLDDKIAKQKEEKTLLEQLEAQLKVLQDAENKWLQAGNQANPLRATDLERNINALKAQITLLKDADNGLNTPKIGGAGKQPIDLGASTTFGSANDLTQMQNTIKALQTTNELRGKAYTDQQKFNESLKITTQVSRVFGQGLTNAFQSVLTGGQNFISAMGKFLGDLITRLIAAAAAAALLAVILSAVGFGTGFGGAATEAGSFKSLFGSFSGLKLADGGITQGPTHALIGEGKENEVVMPLSKLDQYVNGGNGNDSGQWQTRTVFRGADLHLQMKRADKQNGRLS